jgi:hypothetical protein
MVLPHALTVMLTLLGKIPQNNAPSRQELCPCTYLPLYLSLRAGRRFVSHRSKSGSAEPFLHLRHVEVVALAESKPVA